MKSKIRIKNSVRRNVGIPFVKQIYRMTFKDNKKLQILPNDIYEIQIQEKETKFNNH